MGIGCLAQVVAEACCNQRCGTRDALVLRQRSPQLLETITLVRWAAEMAQERQPQLLGSPRAAMVNFEARCESGADLRDSVDAIVVCHVSEITSK